ncbi:MAG: iron ABC transporter permease [Opitutales bacterium]|nr:iron ABC transporter permease [Opitutales bacterium]
MPLTIDSIMPVKVFLPCSVIMSTLRKTDRYHLLMVTLSIFCLLSFISSVLVGTTTISPWELWHALISPEDNMLQMVFWEIRFPRAFLGICVGFSLGITGAVMQGYMRNPLADPGVLGVTGGASMGAVVAFYLGFATIYSYALPIGGILGGFIVLCLVIVASGRNATPQTLILAGIAFSSLAGSVTSLVLNFSPNPHAAMDIVFWLLGSLKDRNMGHLYLSLPLMIPGWLLLLYCSRPLQALTLGEETANSMGFSMKKVRSCIITGSALAVGPAIAVTGSIGFVGLIIPHLLRPLVGGDPGKLLPASGLGGAILLACSDIIVRIVPFHSELKLGVVTSLVGAPFFLYLLLKVRKEAL